jgi:ferredoxin-type protein NapG
VPGAFTVVNGRPTVVEDVCTGCGVCAHVCPAPQNAVLLLPILGRPARPQSASS